MNKLNEAIKQIETKLTKSKNSAKRAENNIEEYGQTPQRLEILIIFNQHIYCFEQALTILKTIKEKDDE